MYSEQLTNVAVEQRHGARLEVLGLGVESLQAGDWGYTGLRSVQFTRVLTDRTKGSKCKELWHFYKLQRLLFEHIAGWINSVLHRSRFKINYNLVNVLILFNDPLHKCIYLSIIGLIWWQHQSVNGYVDGIRTQKRKGKFDCHLCWFKIIFELINSYSWIYIVMVWSGFSLWKKHSDFTQKLHTDKSQTVKSKAESKHLTI